MSSKTAEEIRQAATKIDSSVGQVKVIFDKLYSDTFSMVKDSFTDMRKQVWRAPNNKIEKEQENKLVQELTGKIGDLVSTQSGATTEVKKMKKEVEKLVSQTIKDAKTTHIRAGLNNLEIDVIKYLD